ncbi:MAG: hypothetical protein ACYDG5_01480 [Dehalococcoidales bacterium]
MTVYSEATAKRFIEDTIFLYKNSAAAPDELEKKRYSRIAATLIPYYLECLSNYLFSELLNVELDTIDKPDGLPIPIRRFRAIYKKCTNNDLKIEEYAGIRDIFTIRNKIMAHPAGRSELTATDTGWERTDKLFNYNKLRDLPKIYSDFHPKHVYSILTEVHDFLTKYVTSIKGSLTDTQYNYVWPIDLIALIEGSQNLP